MPPRNERVEWVKRKSLVSQQVRQSEAGKASLSNVLSPLVHQHLARDLKLALWRIKVYTHTTFARKAAASVIGGNTAISRMLALKRFSTNTVILSHRKFSSGVGFSKISMDGRSLLRAKKVQQQFAYLAWSHDEACASSMDAEVCWHNSFVIFVYFNLSLI